MKVYIDPDACMGCGVCGTIVPELFSLGDEGYAIILVDPAPEQYRDLVQRAMDECPEEAISAKD
ncbi:MAG: ferredoxin [Anaerolinea sp.]|nr:ferredoxin [Anaerolinea sp.]